MQTPTSNELVSAARVVLDGEGGVSTSAASNDNRLETEIMPAMASTRDIQTSFYSFQPGEGRSGFRAGKNLVLGKMKNIIINVLERTVMRQQKYNELTFQAIQELKTQIDDLKRAQNR